MKFLQWNQLVSNWHVWYTMARERETAPSLQALCTITWMWERWHTSTTLATNLSNNRASSFVLFITKGFDASTCPQQRTACASPLGHPVQEVPLQINSISFCQSSGKIVAYTMHTPANNMLALQPNTCTVQCKRCVQMIKKGCNW